MDHEVIDSSGTDDDLTQSRYNRVPAGVTVAGNGRLAVTSAPYQRMHGDMETQIHNLEQEAYGAILRAFKAQSDALTWEKEGLITELRKELRVSDDEHRELLNRVNADDLIRRIREWRKAGGPHSAMLNVPQPISDQLPSPTISASRKRQKISQSVTPPFGAPSQTLPHQSIAATTQPQTPSARWGASGAGGMKSRPGQPPYQLNSHGALPTNERAEQSHNPLIGRKVMMRWPEDNNFYEAVISDFNPVEGRHALVYDSNTAKETWEWVDLKEIPPEDIRWVDDDPGVSRFSGSGARGYGASVPSAGRLRGYRSGQFGNESRQLQNGYIKKVSDEIEILHTETLLKKVEKVIDSSYPDMLEIQKAKKMLKEHEQALLDLIAKLARACDNGEDDGEQLQPHKQMLDRSHDHGNAQFGNNNHHISSGTEVHDGRAGGNETSRDFRPLDNQQDNDVIT